MSRLQPVAKDTLDEAGQAVWDRIASARTGVDGPYGVLIHVPGLADCVRALEDYFRFQGSLTDAERELVTLATVRESSARFGWAVHERGGLRHGIDPAVIDTLRNQGELDGLMPRDRMLVEVARSVCRTRSLPAELYGRGIAELGERGLIETVTLVGHYTMIGGILNSFDVEPPEGARTF
jgi:4-carboxymuconolactone decarboxylase